MTDDQSQTERDQYIIEKYKEQEQVMILLFCQWCINEKLDPAALYLEAYPNQTLPGLLTEMIEETVPKGEMDVEAELLIDVLSQFNNDDLAFLVSQYTDKKREQSSK